MISSRLQVVKPVAKTYVPDTPEAVRAVQLACPVTVQRYDKGAFFLKKGMIAVESDLRVRVNGREFSILTRTPGDDLSLIVGHLFTRSAICESGDMVDCSFSYHTTARAEVTLRTQSGIRRIYPSPRPVHVPAERLFAFKETFERRQNLYKNTRSTHAAALFSLDGEMLAFGEDVGRHNAFDKAIGRALLESSLDRVAIAMLSSRLALELTVKAISANIPILCGFSAATSSGVTYAEENNLTLVGSLREASFNVYSNGWRIRAGRPAG
ncbi:formate dehydrogenase accessory sulfurtransferase FdhD [Pseudodesulfovibrio sediminis]|uniref:Protein FdhD n=1 Tax=Pseudodesulfovibrio sediminis TaxID=2810563 RepID=A0ABM8HXE9_9BACT|nr:formate dehydrogenase accessory sulfurtransferase FdhD [Pseudodesulfovibrio sediminis]BCS89826.1 sulfurtransferase FdhD [Pseudodesulfovibrio sediminis]